MTSSVFLSYSHLSPEVAYEIRDGLKKAGVVVLSDDDIAPGQSLSTAISAALRHADAFVIVMTRDSSKSQWARLELGAALASGKPVLPVLAEDGADVPLILRDRVYVDMREPGTRARGLGALLQALKEPPEAQKRASDADGLGLIGDATRELEREVLIHDEALSSRTTRWLRLQGTLLLILLVAVMAAVITAGASRDLVTALGSAVTALFASSVGFYLGAKSRGSDDHDD